MTFDDLSPDLFYVALSYTMPELSEEEEQHETAEYLASEPFDCRGPLGEVKIEDTWRMLWAFGSRKEADRFIDVWGGDHFDELMQMKVTERRTEEGI